MASFEEKDFLKLAKLSRIECSEEEKKKLFTSLSRVVSYVQLLDELDTDGVAPTSHILETLQNVMREDEVGETIPREVFLANAPSHVGGMVRVPLVIKFSNP